MTNASTDLRIELARDGVALCNCGCGETKGGGDFRPGHDAKLKSKLAQAEYDGTKVVLILANGDEKVMKPLEYAETRNWHHKVANQAEKMRRQADIAAKREASKPIGKQNRSGVSTNASYETLKAAARVIRAVGLHKAALGDAYEDFLTNENAAEIAAGTHERVAGLVQRHKASGLFVGQTVAAPEGGYRRAVIEKIERGKVTMRTELIGGGGNVHVVPVEDVRTGVDTPDVPAGVPAGEVA